MERNRRTGMVKKEDIEVTEEPIDMDEESKTEDTEIDDDSDKEPESSLGDDDEIDDESDEPDSEIEDTE